MKLFLFSGLHSVKNNNRLINFSGIDNPTITYIPSSSCSNKSKFYYEQWKKSFKKFKKVRFKYFAIDKPFSKKDLKNAFLTDILYLSGGDTILFCKNIKQKKIDKEIFKFVKKKDKVLSGLSAGAIIMTPKLNIVKLIDKKNNEFNVSGLGLINFEVFPHYQVKQHIKIIFEYSKNNNNPILCLSNNSVGIIEDNKISIFGKYQLINGDSIESQFCNSII